MEEGCTVVDEGSDWSLLGSLGVVALTPPETLEPEQPRAVAAARELTVQMLEFEAEAVWEQRAAEANAAALAARRRPSRPKSSPRQYPVRYELSPTETFGFLFAARLARDSGVHRMEWRDGRRILVRGDTRREREDVGGGGGDPFGLGAAFGAAGGDGEACAEVESDADGDADGGGAFAGAVANASAVGTSSTGQVAPAFAPVMAPTLLPLF